MTQLENMVIEATFEDMQRGMEEGKWTSEALVRSYLMRVEQYDGRINSVLELNPDALDRAAVG